MPTRTCLVFAAMLCSLLAWPGAHCLAANPDSVTAPPLQTAVIDTATAPACAEAIARQAAQLKGLQQDVQRLHREIALLRSELSTPGLTEVLGGIGYIIGLFGLVAWLGRRKQGAS